MAAQRAFQAHKDACPVVLLDLMLPPDGPSRAACGRWRVSCAQAPGAKIIVVSGSGDVHYMLQAVRAGAFDFSTKPVDPDVLLIVVQRAPARVALERPVASLKDSLARCRPGGALVGESPAFLRALSLCERVAASDLPVLLTGEYGTGKELIARYLHARSSRAAGPFVAINCGALAARLLESTLFGHVRGAFTGAVRDRPASSSRPTAAPSSSTRSATCRSPFR